MTKPKTFECSICHRKIHDEFGNNAWPINNGRCCDLCDSLVIAARVHNLLKKAIGKGAYNAKDDDGTDR